MHPRNQHPGDLPRVIQIGFHKCGTRSLESLFRHAGHPVLKYKFRRPLRRSRNAAYLMRENLNAGRKIFAGLENYTLYADLIYQTESDSFEPIRHFREMMRDYPDSILLLNLRDREDWIRSRLKHGHGEFVQRVMRQRGIDSKDEIAEIWRGEWDTHLAEVRAFMADRPEQLVEFNIDTDPVTALVERFSDYGLDAEAWTDIGRTRGIRRHPLVAALKRRWAHMRWRSPD
ncbi:sulfotransferase [Microbulbifer sp.]|uniref:sulfotransferase n=1 Tax=Microbulbifer sp. TaxID=1908541 RepID=UPI002589A1BE|nr:sulfotransferase [Microbulbifer sp.]